MWDSSISLPTNTYRRPPGWAARLSSLYRMLNSSHANGTAKPLYNDDHTRPSQSKGTIYFNYVLLSCSVMLAKGHHSFTVSIQSQNVKLSLLEWNDPQSTMRMRLLASVWLINTVTNAELWLRKSLEGLDYESWFPIWDALSCLWSSDGSKVGSTWYEWPWNWPPRAWLFFSSSFT